jgi:hypothetical protein
MFQTLLSGLAQTLQADPLAETQTHPSEIAGRVLAICVILAIVVVVVKKLGGGKAGKGK